MDHDKMMELLMQIVQDMSFVKAKLEAIDENKIYNRIDQLEAKTKEQERAILSLERRVDIIEETLRNDLVNAKKQQTGIFISMGLAVFSTLLSFIINLL